MFFRLLILFSFVFVIGCSTSPKILTDSELYKLPIVRVEDLRNVEQLEKFTIKSRHEHFNPLSFIIPFPKFMPNPIPIKNTKYNKEEYNFKQLLREGIILSLEERGYTNNNFFLDLQIKDVKFSVDVDENKPHGGYVTGVLIPAPIEMLPPPGVGYVFSWFWHRATGTAEASIMINLTGEIVHYNGSTDYISVCVTCKQSGFAVSQAGVMRNACVFAGRDLVDRLEKSKKLIRPK